MTKLTTDNPIRLVQITDTHLYAGSAGTLFKMNTQESLDHVVDMVKDQEDSIDLILATGDIAQDASETAYLQFLEAMKELDVPFRWIPGNHDSAKLMEEIAAGTDACEKQVQINNWMILFLDTSIEGQVHGILDAGELEFLTHSLEQIDAAASIDHCLICLHHNPVEGSAGWMKDIGLHNGEDFFDIVTRFEKPRCIVYGHIHQELDFEHAGIRCLCSPSTCIQFKPNVTNFTLDEVNPGYRTLHLFEDGKLDSKVHRVADIEFEVDYTSPGY